jgi:ankyrin repeat protein
MSQLVGLETNLYQELNQALSPNAALYNFLNNGLLISEKARNNHAIKKITTFEENLNKQLLHLTDDLRNKPLKELERQMQTCRKIELQVPNFYELTTQLASSRKKKAILAKQEIVLNKIRTAKEKVSAASDFILQKNVERARMRRMTCFERLSYVFFKDTPPKTKWSSLISQGNSFLHAAIQENAIEAAIELIKNGVDLEAKDKSGNTPLMHALTMKNEKVAQLLIESGIDCTKQNKRGWTALHFAAYFQVNSVVNHLIEKGAAINAQNKSGKTAFMMACFAGNAELITFLREKKVDENKLDEKGLHAFHYACLAGKLATVKMLSPYERVENNGRIGNVGSLPTNSGSTPLHYAARLGHEDIVNYLINDTAFITFACDNHGLNALHAAICSNKLSIVKFLLESNCYSKMWMERKDEFKNSALHLAVSKGHEKIVLFLLEKGASVGDKNSVGQTPFHLACEAGRLTIIKILLPHVNEVQKDASGLTPLYTALKKNHNNVLTLLLQDEKERQALQDDYAEAIHKAIQWGNLIGFRQLLQYRTSDFCNLRSSSNLSPLAHACKLGNAAFVRELLQAGDLAFSTNQYGSKPLHFAAENSNPEICRILIEEGKLLPSDINKENDIGQTAIEIACEHGHEDVALLLHQKGANLAGHEEIAFFTPKLFAQLIEEGLDLTKDYSFFVKACSEAPVATILLFLANGVQYSAFTKHTPAIAPLHEFLSFNKQVLQDPKGFKALFDTLKKVVDVHVKDSFGLTPFDQLIGRALLNKVDKNRLKSLFSEFGAFDEIFENNAINKPNELFAWLKKNPEKLISHPKNSPLANPLEIAFLFLDEALLGALANLLPTDKFSQHVQSLLQAFPKSRVKEFLFSTIFTDEWEAYDKTLPTLLALGKEMDVVIRDEEFETPFSALLSPSPHERSLKNSVGQLKALFCDFGAAQEWLTANGCQNFIKISLQHHEKLIMHPKNAPGANPFHVAFLLGSIELGRKIASKMTKREFDDKIQALAKCFLKSPVDEFQFNIQYQIVQAHVKKKAFSAKIPPKPVDSKLDDFLTIFDTINFSEKAKPFYIDIAANGFKESTVQDLRKMICDFINKIKQRKGFDGDLKANSEAYKEFYDTLENAVCGISYALLQKDATKAQEAKTRTILEFLRDIAYCGPKVRTTTVREYNKVVRGFKPTYENLLFVKLADYRSLITDGLVPNGPQSIHDYLKIVQTFGKDFGLSEVAMLGKFNDEYAASGDGIDEERVSKMFYATYNAYNITQTIATEVNNDSEFRELYSTFWSQHVPRSFLPDELKRIKEQVKEMKSKKAKQVEIEKFLEAKDIFFEKGQTAVNAIEQIRAQDFVLQEVFENVSSNRFRRTYFIEAAKRLKVIKPAVVFAKKS